MENEVCEMKTIPSNGQLPETEVKRENMCNWSKKRERSGAISTFKNQNNISSDGYKSWEITGKERKLIQSINKRTFERK